MNTQEVTEQILGAWDEITGDEPAPVETETPEPEEGAVVDTPDEPEEETGEEADEETDGEESDEEAESEEEAESGDEEEVEPEADPLEDPEIKAYLSRYQGDVARALKGAIQLQQAMGRQGQEKAVLTRKVAELEGELAQSQAFTGGGVLLNEEQRQWVGEAIDSGNPTLYVREAIRAGEFDLARAICTEWGNDRPYDALRTAQQVDAAEYAATVQAEPESEPLDPSMVLEMLTEHFPELPQYSAQMAETIAQFGPNHPLVVDARSGDPDSTVRGILGIYEVARASTHALSSTRDEIKNGNREKAASARKRAVVSSGGASPSSGEAPRARSLGPGLTLSELEAEWEANT